MRQRHVFVAVALVTMLPLPINADTASGETDNKIIAQYFKDHPEEKKQLIERIKAGQNHKADADKPSSPVATLDKSLPTLSKALNDYLRPAHCHPAEKVLFFRADPLDNYHFSLDSVDQSASSGQSNAQAKGLSISYTDNTNAHTQTATINGRVSYLLFGARCYPATDSWVGLGFAPFASSNGTWNKPLTKTTSTSALRFGADFQLGSQPPPGVPIDTSYFYVSPFYQTDYSSLAQINGVTLAWEPIALGWNLGSGPYNKYFSFYWQFRGEAEFTEVNNPGLTQFVKGEHSWFGEEVRPHLDLFPVGYGWPDLVAGRISLIGTQQFYWDAATEKTALYYSAVLQYRLGACKVDKANPDLACSVDGSSSISLEYDWGRNKDTYVKTNQILVKLGLSY
jgi:hypothetical protein